MFGKTVARETLNTSPVRPILAAVVAVWAAAALLPIDRAKAQTPVSIELVFAVDTSMSIDGFEYQLLMKGIASAFRAPEVVSLIERQNGVAVTLFQWSSEVNQNFVIPWHLLNDSASVMAFAAKVDMAKRDPDRQFTGIGEALEFGVHLIADNAYEGRLLKIDVSGDGRNNVGIPLSVPQKKANALGIVINGLPILTYTNVDSFDLENYYREEVIQGPGAFIEIADDYEDFARAFLRKLLREISPLISQENSDPRMPIQETQARQRR
jgi:hypothetical protein